MRREGHFQRLDAMMMMTMPVPLLSRSPPFFLPAEVNLFNDVAAGKERGAWGAGVLHKLSQGDFG